MSISEERLHTTAFLVAVVDIGEYVHALLRLQSNTLHDDISQCLEAITVPTDFTT